MKKIVLIILGVIFVIVILSFLFFVGFSKVSTNKDLYETGEEVVVSFSDFRLLRCTTGPNINFYYKTSEGWDKITHTHPITFGRSYCVDGKLAFGAYPADVVSCCILCRPFLSGEYVWPSQIYERKDEKEICGDIPEPILSYRLKLASPGKYKIEFGRAQTIFEIKGTTPEKVSEDETANWEIYSNAEVNFSFKYPPGWEIKQEYQYKSAACQADPNCKGVRYIFLNRIDDTRPANMGEKDKFGIAINMPQCTGVKWSDLPGNNWICVFDENPETLEIFNQILSTFRFLE